MDPFAEYSARLEQFRSEANILQSRFLQIGNWRLIIGLSTAVLAWVVFAQKSVPLWSLLIPVVAFTALAVWHSRIIRRRDLATRALAYYQRGLLRLNDKWIGVGLTGDRHRDPSHVYADDLDIFGKGSLFELVATTRTAAGEDKLARWLLYPAGLAEIRERQSAVAELRPNLQLREDLALLAEDVRPDLKTRPLGSWGAAPLRRFPSFLRPVAFMLAIAGVAAIIGFFRGLLPLWPLLFLVACDASLIFTFRHRVNHVLEGVEASGRDLELLSALVARLERESFSSPRLHRLRSALATTGKPASQRIRQLGRLIAWLDSSDHIFVRALRPVVLWREQLAIAFERWRAQSGPHIGAWIDAVAEFEALSSLAALAFERPTWVTPELLDTPAAQFQAVALRHPLLPAAGCVPNDLALDSQTRLLIVSGSNMSGKSTLLRAAGLLAVLAWAGAPVPAVALKLSPLRIGASIRMNDSLQDHRSRFFAEITRLRQIVDLTKDGHPVLFLLDELLSGTNSHDRRIGAAGIVRELLRASSLGLVTTHDLALAHLEQDMGAGVRNVHFEDQMNSGQMVFDYQLKPGVVTRSNALELMRAVGLEV